MSDAPNPVQLVLDEALVLLGQFLEPDEATVTAILATAGLSLREDEDFRRTLTRALRPRPEDYAKVFVGDAIERARAGYAALWAEDPIIETRPGDAEVRVAVVLAGRLREDPVAQELPGGFLEIADALAPDRLWVAWEFVAAGAAHGVQHNGLVRLDDHYAWFPKPWRVLERG